MGTTIGWTNTNANNVDYAIMDYVRDSEPAMSVKIYKRINTYGNIK